MVAEVEEDMGEEEEDMEEEGTEEVEVSYSNL